MIFNQLSFIFVFLPLALAAFYCPGAKSLRLPILIAASFLFYSLAGLQHAIVLLAAIAWVYLLSGLPGAAGDSKRLIAAVMPPLLALIYFKYLGFLLSPFAAITTSSSETSSFFADVLLPAGISFYTFHLLSFAVDRYRGHILESPPFGRFALYIMFFPQLVAGPIVRYHQMGGYLERLVQFRLIPADAARGISYACIGMAAKVLLADTLDAHQAIYIGDPGGLTVLASIYVVLAYSLQLYFDFFGYSLIAIGLGLLFGIRLPQNFGRPYEARNPREFWRRWHMTLSFWIRDYLYIPLSGNRHYVRNILIVFAICGLWHGAGWTFLVWGLFHGMLVVSYHRFSAAWNVLPVLAQQALTFVLVSLGWTLFLFDFAELRQFLSSLVGVSDIRHADPDVGMWAMLAIAALACFAFPYERWVEGIGGGRLTVLYRTAGCALMLAVALLFFDRTGDFIYFRF